MAEIMGANHYCSHMMTRADLDMESARTEIQSLRRVNQDLESSLADTELARDAAMLSRNDAVEGRDAAIARTHQLELERDRMVSEIQKCRHDRLAMEQLYSDVKKALVAEQSAREAEREKMEAVFHRRLDEVKRVSEVECLEKEQSLRAQIKEEIYTYGVGFRRSALFLIRERHPEIDLSGIDFLSLRGAEVPDKDDGEEAENPTLYMAPTVSEANVVSEIEGASEIVMPESVVNVSKSPDVIIDPSPIGD